MKFRIILIASTLIAHIAAANGSTTTAYTIQAMSVTNENLAIDYSHKLRQTYPHPIHIEKFRRESGYVYRIHIGQWDRYSTAVSVFRDIREDLSSDAFIKEIQVLGSSSGKGHLSNIQHAEPKAFAISPREDRLEIEMFKAALQQFRSRNYQDALLSFRNLEDDVVYTESKEMLGNLINASLYALGMHVEGLVYTCERYADLPLSDTRYLYDIHAHTRKIALTEGYDLAETITKNMKEKCGRMDISYIWIGIPLARMEFLREGFHLREEQFRLSKYGKDREFLEYAIKRYPGDHFIDHALYFLHRFEEALDRYPDSSLSALLNLLMGHRLYDKGKYEEASAYYADFLKQYPKSHKVSEAVISLFLSYVKANAFSKAKDVYEKYSSENINFGSSLRTMRYYCRNIELYGPKIMQVEIDCYSCLFDLYRGSQSDITSRLLSMLVAEGRFSAANDVANRSLSDLHLDARIILGRSLGAREFIAGRHTEAFYFYRQLISEWLPELGVAVTSDLRERMQQLEELISYKESADFAAILRLGIEFRIARYWSHDNSLLRMAISLFDYILDTSPEGPVVEKALYLKASYFRRMGQYEEELAALTEFSVKYPQSHLIDDVILDIGVNSQRHGGGWEEAEIFFEKVYTDYPDTNAADNALFRLAEYHRKYGSIVKAIRYYSKIVEAYFDGRFGNRALDERVKLMIREGVTTGGKGFDGVTLDLDFRKSSFFSGVHVVHVLKDSHARESGLQAGDILIKINGHKIDSLDDYYLAMSDVEIGMAVRVDILRDKKTHSGVLLVANIKSQR